MIVNNFGATTIAPSFDTYRGEARLMTDEAGHYLDVGREFSPYGVVRHGRGDYVVGDVHTNTIDTYFPHRQAASATKPRNGLWKAQS